MRLALFTLLAIVGVTAQVSTPHAQDRWVVDVKRQIVQAAQGWDFAPALHTGALRQNQSVNVTFHLEAGNSYRIIGACDVDCSDVDLKLNDPSGREVDSDTETDDFPVVAASPREDGEYTVKVIMAQCKKAPCRFGVGALIKD